MWVKELNDLVLRSINDDVTLVKTTAQSFKSWDTCMANKTCKIVAIVGIVLGSLLIFWIVATFVQCCCMGVSCIQALCCCCCRSTGRTQYIEKPVEPSPYNNPNMYPPQRGPVYQPTQQAPQQAYFGNQGYQPMHNTSYGGKQNDENPFHDQGYR